MMSVHFWLTHEQMERLRPFFWKSRGKPRVDDRRVLSGIIYFKKNGLQWKDAPTVYGPPKTLYNRFVRWSRMGVFARILIELAQPLILFLSPGQMSDTRGALALLDALPPAKTLLADKGYDADWFLEALEDKRIAVCILAWRGRRNQPVITENSTSSVTGPRICSPV